MSKYSGIDLHSNNCVVAVIDDDDKVCCQKRVPNELERIVALLEPHRDDLVGVVVESTFNWYWLVDGLIEQGFAVKLANTAAIAQYSGMKYSGDEHDARHLAHLLQLKLLRFGHIFRPNGARRGTWHASACRWYKRAPSTSSHWRLCMPGRQAEALKAMR